MCNIVAGAEERGAYLHVLTLVGKLRQEGRLAELVVSRHVRSWQYIPVLLYLVDVGILGHLRMLRRVFMRQVDTVLSHHRILIMHSLQATDSIAIEICRASRIGRQQAEDSHLVFGY